MYTAHMQTQLEHTMEKDDTDIFENVLMWIGGIVLLTLACAVLGTSLGYFAARCGL